MQAQGVKKTKEITAEKENGVVYTPEWIVDLILDKVNYNQNNILHQKIVDPACGDGAFLKKAVERFLKISVEEKKKIGEIKKLLEENIYGIDIDAEAIKSCKNILSEMAAKQGIKSVNWNLSVFDSLDVKNTAKFNSFFDFVVGNPPYVRIQNLGKERRESIQINWQLCQNGSTDIYIAFFEMGYSLLDFNGRLGYITPNTYLKTKAGESLRHFLKYKQCLGVIIDFGHNQLFENATTYSAITILNKLKNESFDLYQGDAEQIKFIDKVDINNLKMNNWVLTSNKLLARIKEIETRGVPLGKMARIHVGITTLADDFYIFKNPRFSGDIAEIVLEDGRKFEIERKILRSIIKASVLKSADEEQNRYIVFPYKMVNGKNSIIPEEELKRDFPLAYKYFSAIKDILTARDKGKPNPVAWYAFGRSQGLDTSFGKKVLTSPMNLKPNFIVWEKEDYTFYAGYCIKFDGDLNWLAQELNSDSMEFYINCVSRSYQHNYKSYAKSFIENFSLKYIGPIRDSGQARLI